MLSRDSYFPKNTGRMSDFSVDSVHGIQRVISILVKHQQIINHAQEGIHLCYYHRPVPHAISSNP